MLELLDRWWFILNRVLVTVGLSTYSIAVKAWVIIYEEQTWDTKHVSFIFGLWYKRQ